MDIREIAKRARVSTATVSRAINRVDPLSIRNWRKRVWNVVEELGYYPNTQARALVSWAESHSFGLIISEITNPFFPEIVQVFERIAVQHHYEILLTSTGNDPKRMETAVRADDRAPRGWGCRDDLWHGRSVARRLEVAEGASGLLPMWVLAGPHVSNIRIDYLHGIRQASTGI